MYCPKVFPSISKPGYIGTVQGKFCGSAKRRPPAETKMCGTLAPFRYFLDRDIGRGADGTDIGQYAVILDQFSGLFDRLRRTEGVVERDQVDLATVDAAGLVDHLEVAGHHAAVAGERRRRPTIGDGLAELD